MKPFADNDLGELRYDLPGDLLDNFFRKLLDNPARNAAPEIEPADAAQWQSLASASVST